MLKFIRGGKYQPTAERLKLQKQLFQFKKTVQHGFPSKPSALAWDPELHLLAVATQSGGLKVFGAPGVEFYAQHEAQHEEKTSPVTKIVFIPNQGRLITICENNWLHLWELNTKNSYPTLEKKNSHHLEGKLKKISCCCLQHDNQHLFIGTEGGNIYMLDVAKFEMTDTIIYQDVVVQNVPDDYKANPGAVEAVVEHPTSHDKILIGYNRGLIVLWNRVTTSADQTYVSSQQLENLCWLRGGSEFISAHNDGSYIKWSDSNTDPIDSPNTVYGPFHCKPITKIIYNTAESGDYVVFAGGMPRSSYGDKYTVSVTHGEENVAFDFTSKVVDFLTICDNTQDSEYDMPVAVVVLAEEELVVIDLASDDWPMFRPAYLYSLHCSAVTCTQLVSNVSQQFLAKIKDVGNKQTTKIYSSNSWPVDGGVCDTVVADSTSAELLLTGHEDGSVRIWDASSLCLSLLYTLTTSHLFISEELADRPDDDDDDEEWPRFKKVGSFDPYSDDPRLGVKNCSLCPTSGILLVSGTAGQIIICNLNTTAVEKTLTATEVNLVSERDSFVWKGHEKLQLKEGSSTYEPGFQPSQIVQLSPPANINSVCIHTAWGVIAAGTAHGFALFDYVQKKAVITKCTLNPNDTSAIDDHPMSRRKSFKKSLRESFRRLRKGRSQRPATNRKAPDTAPGKNKDETKDEKKEKTKIDEASPPKPLKEEKSTEEKPREAKGKEEKEVESVSCEAGSPVLKPVASTPTAADLKPTERAIEARSRSEETVQSMVCSLYMAESYIVTAHNVTRTLWAGTNSGTIYIFTLNFPKSDSDRKSTPVSFMLGKEIQLKHGAPVVDMVIIDGQNKPISSSQTNIPPGPHRVIIISQEQFKVFTLPTLKPYHKYKLTAVEGACVRKLGMCEFMSCDEGGYSEYCVASCCNQGNLMLLSTPDLRRQITANITRKDDVNGVSTLVFSHKGEAFYLHSPSEIQRVSLSTKHCLTVRCSLQLPDTARPQPVQPTPKTHAHKTDDEDEDKDVSENEDKPATSESNHTSAAAPTANNTADQSPAPQSHVTSNNTTPTSPTTHMADLSSADITIDSIKDHLMSPTSETCTRSMKSSSSSSRMVHSEVHVNGVNGESFNKKEIEDLQEEVTNMSIQEKKTTITKTSTMVTQDTLIAAED